MKNQEKGETPSCTVSNKKLAAGLGMTGRNSIRQSELVYLRKRFAPAIQYSYLLSIFILQPAASVIIFIPQNPYSLLEVVSAL